jgi:tRNA nucleotidyltransferase (CCA-adding enzyme)
VRSVPDALACVHDIRALRGGSCTRFATAGRGMTHADKHNVSVPVASAPAAVAPPAAVLDIVTRLEAAGFETWCVGGAVRDALLAQADLDWDLATSAEPREVMRLFPRTVPVGVEHGTVGVIGADGRMYEVTTFRADVATDGRHAVVKFGVSLHEDLARRDFTINALAWSPSRQELRDPFGGRADLDARVVRAVGVAAQRMAEDRLRALRALRFASRFAFSIEPDTWDAVVRSADALDRLSVERVLQEWTKTLEQVRAPSTAFALWRTTGALQALIPALAEVDPVFFDAIDHVPVAAGSRRRERASLRAVVRFALPFLPLGARGATTLLTSLRASKQRISFVSAVSASWTTLAPQLERMLSAGTLDGASLRRAVAAIGRIRVHGTLRAFAAIWAARRVAGQPAPSHAQVAQLARQMWRTAFRDPIAIGDLAIAGDDLQQAGITPGPSMGRTLQLLLDAVLHDPTLNTRAQLLSIVTARTTET